jgi:hypothetical protein
LKKKNWANNELKNMLDLLHGVKEQNYGIQRNYGAVLQWGYPASFSVTITKGNICHQSGLKMLPK